MIDSGTILPGGRYTYEDYVFSLTVDDSNTGYKDIIASCANTKSGNSGSKRRSVGKSSVVEGWHVVISDRDESDSLTADVYAIGTFTDVIVPTSLRVVASQTKKFYEADEIGQRINFTGLVVGAYRGGVLYSEIPIEELLFSSYRKPVSELTPSDYYAAEDCIVQSEQFPGFINGWTSRVNESSNVIWYNDITFSYEVAQWLFTYTYSALNTEDGLPKARFFFAATESDLAQNKVSFYITYIYKVGTSNKNIASYTQAGYDRTYYIQGNVGDSGQTRFICSNEDLNQFENFLNSLSQIENTGYYKSSNDDLIYRIVYDGNTADNIQLSAKTYRLSSYIKAQYIDRNMINVLDENATYPLDGLVIELWTKRVWKDILAETIRVSWNNLNITNPSYIWIEVVQP